MSRPRRRDVRLQGEIDAVHEKVRAALRCVNLMCPNLDARGKRRMVNAISSLGDGKARTVPQKQITESEVVEMVLRQCQCIKPRCPLLIFGRQLASDLNAFFNEENE